MLYMSSLSLPRYVKYDSNRELQSLYETYEHHQIFRGVDRYPPLGFIFLECSLLVMWDLRIKLILSIVEAPISETPPGCGLSINQLSRGKTILAAFAIHDEQVKE